MIRRPPRSTPLYSSAASDVYKRQLQIYSTRLSQTRTVITTVAAQHLQTLHTHWRCALGRAVTGLSAVLWISIPATASIVAPKRTEQNRVLGCRVSAGWAGVRGVICLGSDVLHSCLTVARSSHVWTSPPSSVLYRFTGTTLFLRRRSRLSLQPRNRLCYYIIGR